MPRPLYWIWQSYLVKCKGAALLWSIFTFAILFTNVKKAKELKTITLVAKLTFPYQLQSSTLNILERNGSAGFLTT